MRSTQATNHQPARNRAEIDDGVGARPNVAAAVVGDWSRVMVTVLVELHGPLVIVQRNTFAPWLNPLTVVPGSFASVKLPVPLSTVHVPVPTPGVLAANVALVVSQNSWFGPATDVDVV